MKEKEKVVENVLRETIKRGGKIYYANTEFSRAVYQPNYLADINAELLRFGSFSRKPENDGTWDCFEINTSGREFINNGGYAGENQRKEQQRFEKDLDNKSKLVAIDTANASIRLSKRANTIAITAIVISAIAILIEIIRLLLWI